MKVKLYGAFFQDELKAVDLTTEALQEKYFGTGGMIIKELEAKVPAERTLSQNAAMHRYCELMAKALNDAGYDYVAHINKRVQRGVDVPWDMEKVKESWRMVQMAMFGIESTAKLEPKQVSQVYEVVNRQYAECSGCSMPFPNRFDQMQEAMNNG